MQNLNSLKRNFNCLICKNPILGITKREGEKDFTLCVVNNYY